MGFTWPKSVFGGSPRFRWGRPVLIIENMAPSVLLSRKKKGRGAQPQEHEGRALVYALEPQRRVNIFPIFYENKNILLFLHILFNYFTFIIVNFFSWLLVPLLLTQQNIKEIDYMIRGLYSIIKYFCNQTDQWRHHWVSDLQP
jgi:hypothetical protein